MNDRRHAERRRSLAVLWLVVFVIASSAIGIVLQRRIASTNARARVEAAQRTARLEAVLAGLEATLAQMRTDADARQADQQELLRQVREDLSAAIDRLMAGQERVVLQTRCQSSPDDALEDCLRDLRRAVEDSRASPAPSPSPFPSPSPSASPSPSLVPGPPALPSPPRLPTPTPRPPRCLLGLCF